MLLQKQRKFPRKSTELCFLPWIRSFQNIKFPRENKYSKFLAMMTSSNGISFSALLARCAGNSPVTGEFPAQRPVARSFDVFFRLCLNERLSKQSRCWWFETLSRSLWRHCNVPNALHPRLSRKSDENLIWLSEIYKINLWNTKQTVTLRFVMASNYIGHAILCL